MHVLAMPRLCGIAVICGTEQHPHLLGCKFMQQQSWENHHGSSRGFGMLGMLGYWHLEGVGATSNTVCSAPPTPLCSHSGPVYCREGRACTCFIWLQTPAEVIGDWGMVKNNSECSSGSPAAPTLQLHVGLSMSTHAQAAGAMLLVVVDKQYAKTCQSHSHEYIPQTVWLLVYPLGVPGWLV